MKTMHRRIVTAIFLVVYVCSLVIPGAALEQTDIFSNEALVVDLNTDQVLYSKNTKQESVQIASLTKIMTYVLTIEHIPDLNTLVTVPEGTKQDIIDKEGSNSGLEDGYSYSALDLLYGLMLPSGCDAADVLAKHIGQGDYDKFIQLMNEKAQQLGMVDTVFYSASGLEENGNNNLSTEQDLYKLAKLAYSLPYFKQIIATEYYDVIGTKGDLVDKNTVRNTNYMMGPYNGAEYYYLYSLGGKTGNLSGAGRCLISFAKKGELEVVAITLGVPNQHSNYHLTDHRKLFDHVFETYTENITVDIGSEYKSVDIGKKIQLVPVTSQQTTVTWHSSDESVATVNDYGVVTGHKLGQARITATTQTGNQDYAYVSVGFYNGIDIKYNAGPSDSNGILGYGVLDWQVVKNAGIDFAVIRAGYAYGNVPDYDPYFVTNITNATAQDMNIMISFDGYATNAGQAVEEAQYLIKYLNENIADYLPNIQLPIVYNLYPNSTTDPDALQKVIFAFQEEMQAAGYEIIVELGKTLLSTLDLAELKEAGIDFYIIYRPYVPDFQTKMTATSSGTDYEANLWQYRSDAYFGEEGIASRIIMSTMYMDTMQIPADHGAHDESLYPEKPQLQLQGSYTYSGQQLSAAVSGYDPDTMNIEGAAATDAGTYTITVTPKEKWKDGSTTPVNVSWTIEKALPQVEAPKLTVKKTTLLQDISLPQGFGWKNPAQAVTKTGSFDAVYTPEDTRNYQLLELQLTVEMLPAENNNSNWQPQQPTSPEQPTEPTQPQEPTTEPTEPATEPTQPQEPVTEPTEPATEPVQPATTEPAATEQPPQPAQTDPATDLTWLIIGAAALLIAAAVVIVLVKKKK